jgi:hypothetical protein
MPHSKCDTPYFERTNDAFTLTIMAAPKVGIPYGSLPTLAVVLDHDGDM